MRITSLRCSASALLLLALPAGCGDDSPSNGTEDPPADTTGPDDPTTGPPVATTGGPGPGTTGDGTADDDSTTGVPSCSGQALPTPGLVMPMDGSIDVPTEAELCWSEVDSPDGNPVRYRVIIDGIDITDGGKIGEPGAEGSCIGPLNFNYEQLYQWQVQAFDPACPDADSSLSELWSFQTMPDGITVSVFEDPFTEDLGWELGGDALSGDWMRGNPVPTVHSGNTAQPDDCAGGDWCVFTGQNQLGAPSNADVDGGSTTLTSPPFDLSGYAAVSVTLDRFVYKSSLPESGTQFRVELLVPDAGEPSGYQVVVLELLDTPEQVGGANMWTPREYAACEVPMLPGTRLRLVATDLGNGIFESAVDNVVVRGHTGTSVCEEGEGAICNPDAADPCTGDLLCCAQGTFNHGVYRCTEAAPSVTYPDPGGPLGTFNGPLGCPAPDIFVEENAINAYEQDIFVAADSCLIYEGCINAPGWRRVLRFNTFTPNAGATDLTMGVPSNHPDLYHFSECHGHYHFDGYANYELVDGAGSIAATGHKQAFCLIDLTDWSGWNNINYGCGNQGISVGTGDTYSAGLDCQFIDITDVTPGDYTLRIELNRPLPDTALPPLVERDYGNNVSEVPVTVVGG